MNPALRRRIDQIRERWWVVVLVMLLAVLAAGASSITALPTYVGKSTLIISSPGRSPQEDSVLAAGYAALFNDPATLERLQAEHYVPDAISFEAGTAAASPILTIDATAYDADTAQAAAEAMANAFRDDVNSVRRAGLEQTLADLQFQLDQALAAPALDGTPNPLVGALQERIHSARTDSTNRLQDLQLRAGVTEESSNLVTEVALATVGGAILGVLAALGLALVSTRLRHPDDVHEKTEVELLVEIPNAGSTKKNRLRGNRLRTILNIVGGEGLRLPTVLALTDAGRDRSAQHLGSELAELWAKRGERAVVIDAASVVRAPGDGEESSVRVEWIRPESPPAPNPLAQKSITSTRRLACAQIPALLAELRPGADRFVIAAPPIVDSSDAELLCAAADRTILVIAKGTKARQVTAASEALHKVRAAVLGAVLLDPGKSRPKPAGTHRRDTGPHQEAIQAAVPAAPAPDAEPEPDDEHDPSPAPEIEPERDDEHDPSPAAQTEAEPANERGSHCADDDEAGHPTESEPERASP